MGRFPSSRPVLLGAALLLLSAAPAFAGGARPFFAIGLSVPVSYEDAGVGLGYTAGLETEVDSRTSFLFRTDLEVLGGSQPSPAVGIVLPADGPGGSTIAVEAPDLRFATAGLGVRVQPASSARVRGYAEALVGARIGLDRRTRSVPAGWRPDARHEGVVGALRVGLSTAPRGGPGLVADAGWEFVMRNPGRFGVIPVRFGIVLP
jgi:hypothetical protein